MKKDGRVAFRMNVRDFANKNKADRYLIYYKQLLKNRLLTRFCREAFIEKVERKLNGQEEQYTRLYHHIKAKGIPYILEAIREKESQSPRSKPEIGEVEIEKAVKQIVQALMKEFQTELQILTPIDSNPVPAITLPANEPDLVKLMALL